MPLCHSALQAATASNAWKCFVGNKWEESTLTLALLETEADAAAEERRTGAEWCKKGMFVKQKQKDFDSKYEIIHRLKKQCQEDNITVPAGVQMAIHHVESLYGNLPKLREKAKEGL